jgi:hypothetical protein
MGFFQGKTEMDFYRKKAGTADGCSTSVAGGYTGDGIRFFNLPVTIGDGEYPWRGPSRYTCATPPYGYLWLFARYRAKFMFMCSCFGGEDILFKNSAL